MVLSLLGALDVAILEVSGGMSVGLALHRDQ